MKALRSGEIIHSVVINEYKRGLGMFEVSLKNVWNIIGVQAFC